jgi:DNA (cytosine-5)-methyltransferase 1
MKINLLSLFSGIEGFALGLEKAGFEINKHYTAEIDKYASQITRRNYPGAMELGSVTTVTKEKVKEEIDILTFGSPCQDLSIAGKRKGLGGARSGLFIEAIRIIKEVKPKIFIWENVKGAFSSNKGRDFEEVLRQFADLRDYEYGEWQLLNTRWVLPQNRERIYFVGHLRGTSFGKVFPIGENESVFKKKYSRRNNEPLPCITATEYKGASKQRPQNLVYWKNSKEKWINEEKNYTPVLKTQNDICRQTLLQVVNQIRRLTPVECERLQGFPDGWTAKGIDNKGNEVDISDTQRYKCCGNAVTADIVALIGRRLLNAS